MYIGSVLELDLRDIKGGQICGDDQERSFVKVSILLAEGASDPSADVYWFLWCARGWLAGVQLPPSCWFSCALLPFVDS